MKMLNCSYIYDLAASFRTARCSLVICVWPAIAIVFGLIQETLRRINGSVYETFEGLQYGLVHIIYTS